jgi:RNase P/RNase MRP subunit p30
MFYDIVFPKNNEKDFISIAEKLDIDGLVFTYPYVDKKTSASAKSKIVLLQKTTKIKLKIAFEATGTKIYKVHDINEIVIAKASENSRDVIARYMPNVAYDLELSAQKDFAKARNSGLDKAICQFANKNSVLVAVSFSNILNSSAQLIGRVKQNIKLCKKYKVKTMIGSFAKEPYAMRSPHELKAVLLSLGMYTSNAKQSIEAVCELIEQTSY